VLEKDGEDRLDRSCEERRNITQSQGRREYPSFKETSKIKRIAYILRRNCLLKHFIEGKIEGRTEVADRRGRRRKQLLNDLKETRRHWKMKKKEPDRTL
jgi:hypothetical protein